MRSMVTYLIILGAALVHASPFTAMSPSPSKDTLSLQAIPTFRGTGLHHPTPVASLTRPTGSGCQRNTTTKYTLPVPKVTPPPAAGGVFFEPESETAVAEVGAKFRQTTYYTCVTWPSTVHCGWHEPILDASMNAAWSGYGSRKAAAWGTMAAIAALAVVMGT
ncbi:hypothetical protein BKA67DRAFT_535036 [Truncatella angustata]|uniref:Uncharacterized protein n=1 Tax=Truncatella angustata TaxID=152316 RepID=A0A9P8UQ21_9PEZI|nr:uncharacterized protein BKA67DRAFT_535036 [Truncatella angustata]KAH6656142.1 hypothetical protein BKA67DRAFT_535036 [Truncatella angustata]KAH8195509.1 hypothetical protein TruAng_010316 [Truncatella angustata]